jgi:hypothetical protein
MSADQAASLFLQVLIVKDHFYGILMPYETCDNHILLEIHAIVIIREGF